jgi:hypothetical protein
MGSKAPKGKTPRGLAVGAARHTHRRRQPDDLTERIARAERRRLQSIFGGLVALLAVVSTLAVFAWIQRNNAVEQSLMRP